MCFQGNVRAVGSSWTWWQDECLCLCELEDCDHFVGVLHPDVHWGVNPGLSAVGPALQGRVNLQSQGSGSFPTWALVSILAL